MDALVEKINAINALLVLLAFMGAAGLFALSVYGLKQDKRDLILSVSANVISVLVSFVFIYIFLQNQGNALGTKSSAILSVVEHLKLEPIDIEGLFRNYNEIQKIQQNIKEANSLNGNSIQDLQRTLEGDLKKFSEDISQNIEKIKASNNIEEKERLLVNVMSKVVAYTAAVGQVRVAEINGFQEENIKLQTDRDVLKKGNSDLILQYKNCDTAELNKLEENLQSLQLENDALNKRMQQIAHFATTNADKK